ncbi:unnamed protein product [Discosporangium mesarthrocarpum]
MRNEDYSVVIKTKPEHSGFCFSALYDCVCTCMCFVSACICVYLCVCLCLCLACLCVCVYVFLALVAEVALVTAVGKPLVFLACDSAMDGNKRRTGMVGKGCRVTHSLNDI